LPEAPDKHVSITPLNEGERPPDHFLTFMQHAGAALGAYPGVFSYRFEHFADDKDQPGVHYWALLIWDCVLITVMFIDPLVSASPTRAPADSAYPPVSPLTAE
jgi:hypothetical protein